MHFYGKLVVNLFLYWIIDMFFMRLDIILVGCFLMLFQQPAHSHELVEKTVSREYFCNKVMQPLASNIDLLINSHYQ
ncbi:hypothetical protein HBNCFIEN_02984 [Legionella sp. PC997]|nr:hypothetical protein HBNCFIEN_02984 [Legionella sp. PC997]